MSEKTKNKQVDSDVEPDVGASSGRQEVLRIALVAARGQGSLAGDKLVNSLMRSAVGALMSQRVNESQMRVMWSPRIFQLPLLAQSMAQSREFDGILVLGVQVKDERTDGYYFENAETMRALMDVMMSSTVPINHCLVMTENQKDAQKIVETKGEENLAARAATELVDLLVH